MPRLAALSNAEIRPRICSGSGLSAARTRFCNVRSRVRTPRFWVARVRDCRERFAADFVFAMIVLPKIYERGRSRRQTKCQDVDLESGPRAGGDLDWRRIFSQPRSRSRSVKTVNFGIGHLRGSGQSILNNLNWRAERQLIVKRGHVVRSHPDAAEAGRPADYFLFVGSVNVNAALKSMGIGGLQSTQPNNARHDRITPRSIRPQHFAGPATIVKNRSKRRVVANFLRDLQ